MEKFYYYYFFNWNVTAFQCCARFAVYAKSLQSCPSLCNPIDCSPPDSSVHGILQTRILGWNTMPSSRVSSWPRDWTQISCSASGFFTVEPSGKTSFCCEVKWSEVAQSCLTLCDPKDCSLPGSSVRGIFQARILEWVAISFSAVHKCKSAGCIHIPSLLSWPTHPQYHSSRSSPCAMQQLPTNYLLYTWQAHTSMICSQIIPRFLPLLCPHVDSLLLHLRLCSANRFFSTIFLESMYMHHYTIFVFLFLT